MSSAIRSPKIERDRTALGAGKLLDQKAREEQHFEAVAKSVGEKAHDSQAADRGKRPSRKENGKASVASAARW